MTQKDKADQSPEAEQEIPETPVDAPAEKSETAAIDAAETEEVTAEADLTDVPEEEASDVDDVAIEEEVPAAPQPIEEPPAPQQIITRKAGFLPMLLGGVAAAAIGFGMARFVLPEGWPWPGTDDSFQVETQAALTRQRQAMEALSAKIDGMGQAPDLSGVEAGIAENKATLGDLDARITQMGQTFGALEGRMSDLEKRPVTDGASPAAVAAYERELKALQEAMAAQRAEIESIAEKARQEQADAEMTEREAMMRGSLTRIWIALENGTGFAEELANLQAANLEIPAELSAIAEGGVATLTALQEAFPDNARAALAAARSVGGENAKGLGAFLRNQLGARSLEPQEGTSADAILSRAEAALGDGRLGDSIAEIQTLPEVAQAALSDWVAQANARQQALAAAAQLGQNLNLN